MIKAEYLERDLAACRRQLACFPSWRKFEYLIKQERRLTAQLDQALIDAAIDNLQPTPHEVTHHETTRSQGTEASHHHLGRA